MMYFGSISGFPQQIKDNTGTPAVCQYFSAYIFDADLEKAADYEENRDLTAAARAADFNPAVCMGYTANGAPEHVRGPDAIRTEKVLTIINEVNETLALSNEPGLLVPASLDTLCGALDVEGAWLQAADGETLLLAGSRGLTPAIEAALTNLGKHAALRQRVLGRGETVALPDLSARGTNAPAAFRQAGFRWLVAAPLMTHRAGGILGVVSKHSKKYDKDLPPLVRVVAGMVGGALQKARLAARKPEPAPPPCGPLPELPAIVEAAPSLPEDAFFQRHKHRMAHFRHEHPERRS